ncbi:MAG: hypothetical protein ABJN84_14020 [Flavobacteriaceae bacterium]
MNLIKQLKSLDLKSILTLLKLCFRFPLFVFPTVSATKECMSISTEHYSREHYKNGPANAFRHAFWNYVIAKKCFRWRKHQEAVLLWTKRITDWHEHAFPNRELARKMDLHNNEVGRFIFSLHSFKTDHEVIEILKKMTLTSSKVDSNSNFVNFKNRLVHIIDDQ